MHKLKKISSFLSILLALSISLGTFPLSALAQYYSIDLDEGGSGVGYSYNGEIQAPNSSVLSSLAATGAFVGALPFNESFPTPPSFSAGANNNWDTSLLSKTFSIVGSDSVGNGCVVSLVSNSSLGINVSSYDDETGRTTWSTSCSPDVSVATTQNVSSGGVSGNPVTIQTSEVLPLAVFGEETLVTRVESIQNDPDNVRVTVGVDSTVEAYGARFQRIDGVSDWVGHVAIDPETNRASLTDVEKSGDAQLPQGVKIAASSPSERSFVERPRNSDIIDSSITQPKCRQWSDGNFWRTVQHVHCVEYALSADGRTGRADYYDSAASAGWFREMLGVGLIAVSIVTGGEFLTSIFNLTEFTAASFSSLFTAEGIAGSVANTVASQAIAITTGAVAMASGASTIGTVESTVASSPPPGTEKAWVWTWSELPAQPTVCPTGQIGTPPACTCANGLNISTYPTCVATSCPSGTTGVYPDCRTTIGTVTSLPQSVTVTVCSGNTPIWDPGTNSCKSATPTPSGAWSYPSSCPTACGTAASTQTQVCTSGNGACSGTPSSRSCSATAACSATSVTPVNNTTNNQGGGTPGGGSPNDQGGQNQGGQNQGGQNQGNPSVTISADPNRVRSGDTSTISWTLNNVNNCSITKNGTTWKSDVSSSGGSVPQEIITAQTTYTITCPSTSPESVTVNILPVFQEF